MDNRKFALTIPGMTDEPCTQEDRDKIRAAAFERKAFLNCLIEELEIAGGENAKSWFSAYARSLFLDAAAQLRQLTESV
jgi:hypothetical protein